MTSTATVQSSPLNATARTPKQQFLAAYDREHATTMKVLRAYPREQAELRPHEKSKTARELAFVFVLERGLGKAVMANVFASGAAPGGFPEAPKSWDEVIAALEGAHEDFRKTVDGYTDDQLNEPVKFFSGPGTMADYSRLEIAWFMLHDQIHHRGQLSVYLRMAGAKVPSIYGPSLDEPWM